MKSMRDIMRYLPDNGEIRQLFRNFNISPIIEGKARSVKEFAERLGFEVDQVDLPKGMTGRLVKDAFARAGYRIEVNRNHSVEARRFAVLHEIGHFFRHADHEDPFAFDMHFDASGNWLYFDEDRIKEREANEFAETLLFGDGALQAAYSLHFGNIERVRRHFGVSDNVLRIALKRFNIR
ncbi:ImmA/IrrE family metallo-endopeptidase [Sinisalibacter aestuarii]|uniref:IrrE N-terminal-like domain-containing protein n=1 Tax=Sinisalibacter aestuarii TaxID=2949426 RepID=A0ABQ5LXH5_9RHOB|nr:ImmA/IrrE family metallo-endopeptidase [Sinisalibacter aestuarii]GKY88961.1 hypothetical protein STA1M1_28300 [Sinisalibacter aestuarii]